MKNFTIIVLILISSYSVSAQFEQNVEFVQITMKDGSIKNGIFISMDKKTIVYNANGKNYTVRRSLIEKFKLNESAVVGDIDELERKNYPENYFIFPSALPAGKGNMYYRNYNVFLNQFTFGLSDNFTLSTGFESASIFVGGGLPVMFFAPKLSFGQNNVTFGIGTTVFAFGGDFASLTFVNTTLGSKRTNFTIGASYLYNGDNLNSPILLNLNAAFPISEKISFIGEGVIFETELVSLNLGIRYTTKNNIAVDAAIIKIAEADFLIPVLGITLPFGKNRKSNN